MIWFSIPGYTGLYEVSTDGRVRSVARTVAWGRHGQTRYKQKELKQFASKNGYACVKLAKRGVTRTEYVHELVLRAFAGPRPETVERGEIRHLDGDKTNNTLQNLCYGTVKENAADRVAHKRGRP